MSSADPSRRAQALEWARRLHDPTFSEWDEHIAWLERSPDNSRALDEVLLHLAAVDDALAHLPPVTADTAPAAANDQGPGLLARTGRWAWAAAGSAVAAGLVAVAVITRGGAGDVQRVSVAIEAGKSRQVALADGSSVTLAPGAALRIDARAPRRMTLERGAAVFAVVHRAGSPFRVEVGDATVEDVGTIFRVNHASGRTEVDVREGGVVWTRATARVHLASGDALSTDGSGPPVVRRAGISAAGSNPLRTLAYTQASIARIAQDLAQATGSPFSVDPAVANTRFSGILSLDGTGAALASRLEAVTGLAVRPDGRGWRIASPHR